MFNIFGRGKKKKPESKDKSPDDVIFDFMAKIKEDGGAVIDARGGQAKKLSKSDIEGQQRALELEKLGDALFESSEYSQAIEAYKKSIELYSYETPYMSMGNAYASMGDFETGIHYLKKSLEINPKYERARKNLEAVKIARDMKRSGSRWKAA